jgi:hypothetical protein
VYIRNIFVYKPLTAIAVLICLATLIALFKLNRRGPRQKTDKFLIAFLGVLTIYEGLKLLRNSGAVAVTMNAAINDGLELLVAATCLTSAMMLRMSRVNHLNVESAIRLARAAPPRTSRGDLSLAPKDLLTQEMLSWAIPRLSDGAFKLLVILCIRAEASPGRLSMGVSDVQLKLGKSKEETETYLDELQAAGAVAVHRFTGTLEIEIVTQPWRPPPSSSEDTPLLVASSRK